MKDAAVPHHGFYGNEQDLEQFLRLAASPARSKLRDAALSDWGQYMLAKQTEHVSTQGIVVGGRTIKHRPGKKDAGIVLRAMAPAIDLHQGETPGHMFGICGPPRRTPRRRPIRPERTSLGSAQGRSVGVRKPESDTDAGYAPYGCRSAVRRPDGGQPCWRRPQWRESRRCDSARRAARTFKPRARQSGGRGCRRRSA